MNIKRNQLIRVLSEYFPEEEDALFQDIADELEEGEETSSSDVSTFIKLLTYYRRRVLKHRLVKLNMKHNYPYVDKIIDSVNEFCTEFNLSRREGYLEFIKIAIELMGKTYRIGFFQKHVDRVFEVYENKRFIENNPHKDLAREIQDHYILKALKMSGLKPEIGYSDKRNFAEASLYCAKNKVPSDVLVDAVFDVLAWKNAIPSTSALTNEKFLSKIPDYMARNDLVVKDNVLVLSLKSLKNMRDD